MISLMVQARRCFVPRDALETSNVLDPIPITNPMPIPVPIPVPIPILPRHTVICRAAAVPPLPEILQFVK